jgi:hypothetical protein
MKTIYSEGMLFWEDLSPAPAHSSRDLCATVPPDSVYLRKVIFATGVALFQICCVGAIPCGCPSFISSTRLILPIPLVHFVVPEAPAV